MITRYALTKLRYRDYNIRDNVHVCLCMHACVCVCVCVCACVCECWFVHAVCVHGVCVRQCYHHLRCTRLETIGETRYDLRFGIERSVRAVETVIHLSKIAEPVLEVINTRCLHQPKATTVPRSTRCRQLRHPVSVQSMFVCMVQVCVCVCVCVC